MNALAVAWKLRSDLLAIAAAASPKHELRESQLMKASRGRRQRTNSDIHELVATTPSYEAEFESAPASGDGRHG